MVSLQQKLNEGRALLLKKGCESAPLDAKLIMSYVTNLSKVELIIRSEDSLSAENCALYDALIKKRATGYPIAYILGFKEFWGFNLKVSPDVLIPRPDTETLVEQALTFDFKSVLDMGTGSGAVILAIKHERSQCRAYACDISDTALQIAKENAKNLHLEVVFKKSSWFEAYQEQRFDLIVSNPPYIREGDVHLAQSSLPFEPQNALVSGSDGLRDIQLIIKNSLTHLNAGGHLLLEHGYDQGAMVRELFHESHYVGVKTVKDLGQNDRVTIGRIP